MIVKDMVKRSIEVVRSCSTFEQLKIASNYCKLFIPRVSISKRKRFLRFIHEITCQQYYKIKFTCSYPQFELGNIHFNKGN